MFLLFPITVTRIVPELHGIPFKSAQKSNYYFAERISLSKVSITTSIFLAIKKYCKVINSIPGNCNQSNSKHNYYFTYPRHIRCSDAVVERVRGDFF